MLGGLIVTSTQKCSAISSGESSTIVVLAIIPPDRTGRQNQFPSPRRIAYKASACFRRDRPSRSASVAVCRSPPTGQHSELEQWRTRFAGWSALGDRKSVV